MRSRAAASVARGPSRPLPSGSGNRPDQASLPWGDALLPLVDVLVVARQFAERVTGEADPAAAGPLLLRTGAREVVITDGANGCWYWDASCTLHQPAFEVAVVDTTGAGDVFHGAYLSAWLQGWGPAQRLRFASATAAIKCTQPGGRLGIPATAQVLDFLKERGSAPHPSVLP